MAEPIAMPRLGWTMEEGTLVEWLKADGDTVEVGEILFTVESDKALNEIETFSGASYAFPRTRPDPAIPCQWAPCWAICCSPARKCRLRRLQRPPQSRLQRLRNPRP